MPIEVLGVKIDQITHTEALQKVGDFLLGEGQHTIFTPNPEMLVKAQKDEYFKKVLNSSSLNLCDGFGLWLAVKQKIKKTKKLPFSQEMQENKKCERIAGTDFMLDICQIATEQNRGVYLLGSGSDEVIRKTAESLQKQFPNLKIVGYDKGPTIVESMRHHEEAPHMRGDVVIPLLKDSISQGIATLPASRRIARNDAVIEKINSSRAEILFIAFGMGKQEKWIYENLAKMPNVKIAMGVGGAFDYISGKVPRAPRLMRKIGLEWVYRLLRQPRRAGRIFNATVKFVIYSLKNI